MKTPIKHLIGPVILLLLCSFRQEKTKNYWKILESVKLTSAVEETTEFLYLKPRYPPKVRRLEGKAIRLEGYLVYLGRKGYVLTKYLSSRGQHRSLAPGPKEMVVLSLSPHIRYRRNRLVEVEGQLKLNRNNPKEPIYTLKNVNCLDCERN